MPQTPLNQDVAAALSRFFTGGSGPTHAELDEVFARNGLARFDPKRVEPNTTKEVRVRTVLTEAITAASSETGTRLVEMLLARMRVRGSFDPDSSAYPPGGSEVIAGAQRAFRRLGWELDDEGDLAPAVLTGLDHHLQRRAIEAAIERIRRSPNDAALLIGAAKELLESTSKYVLEEIAEHRGGTVDQCLPGRVVVHQGRPG